jgi:hypothetical protein
MLGYSWFYIRDKEKNHKQKASHFFRDIPYIFNCRFQLVHFGNCIFSVYSFHTDYVERRNDECHSLFRGLQHAGLNDSVNVLCSWRKQKGRKAVKGILMM